MSKRFWIIIAAIAVIFIGFLYFGGNKGDKGSSSASTSNHVKGKLDSKVTLIEYGDFQCPVCGGYYPIVTQLMEKYQDKIKFQFRNLPLSQVHPNAFAAARAAEAASEQGKFWQMYDQLFTNQTTWSSGSANSASSYFKQYAAAIGLDSAKFDKAFSSSQVNNAINADMNEFKKTGDPLATPTFYLNGKNIPLKEIAGESGAPTLENFSAKIDAALKAAGQQ